MGVSVRRSVSRPGAPQNSTTATSPLDSGLATTFSPPEEDTSLPSLPSLPSGSWSTAMTPLPKSSHES